MRFRVYIATSLYGYVATPDGGVEWLEPFQDEDYGYNSFIQEIGTVIMGRTTFQQVLGFGQWPYKDLRVMVLSSHPLQALPANTSVWLDTPTELLAHLRETGPGGDVWVLGGPRTINAFMDLGAIDSYELFLMPILLARIHRRTSLGTALEEASGCSSESGIMVLEQKPARKQGAPNRCCHRTNPTVSASSLTTIAWWPMPACSCRPP